MAEANIATVKKSTGSWYQLLLPDGSTTDARVRGKLRLKDLKVTNPVAVGDQVEFETDSTGQVLIKAIKERINYIIRRSNNLSRQAQIIASNLDQVVIVATLAAPRTSPGFIDRLLVNAEAYGIPAMLFLNKRDMLNQAGKDFAEDLAGHYTDIGYPSYIISTKIEEDIALVKHLFEGKTTLVTGHSGVGKSTLLNRLISGLELKTGQISGYSMKGKHTTTFAEMHLMDDDPQSRIIDTPGIKDFGVIDIEKAELGHYFPEFRQFIEKCRFNNCLHINEPGCAVLPVVNEYISESRYHSYLSILNEEDTHG